jgi:hypothetical protein
MNAWGWIVAYAVGLVILQVLVYRYLWRRSGPIGGDESGRWRAGGRDQGDVGPRAGTRDPVGGDEIYDRGRERASDRGVDPSTEEGPGDRDRPPEADPSWVPGAGAEAGAGTPSGRTCSHCGAVNEPDRTFDRCWNCTEPLN